MRRRHYLATVTAVGLAGCSVGHRRSVRRDADPAGDLQLPVPEGEIHKVLARDAIPAITDPSFGADWSGISFEARGQYVGTYTARPRLGETDRVVGVVRDGEARAYPLEVLDWHEAVNDSFGGPLVVTYCPLCGSAVVAERTVGDEETVFGVSGNLWRHDMVLYDRATDSLWSQLLATAIRGPATAESLELVPARLATWAEWTAEYPDSRVLRPPPESNTVSGREATRNYSRDPYLGYETSERVGIAGEYDDGRLHPKASVLGIAHDGESVAYPRERVAADGGVVNDTVGGLPVVVATAGPRSMVAYDRRVEGEVPWFRADGEEFLRGGGSRWAVTSGVAVAGPHDGTALRPATGVPQLFFFAWLDFNPETRVYGQ